MSLGGRSPRFREMVLQRVLEFVARDTRLDPTVAIKVLPEHVAVHTEVWRGRRNI